MKFCTVINCMDGRIQLPVINFLRERFNAENVDNITEAGPDLILHNNNNPNKIDSIFKRVEISIEAHKSVGIAVVGHPDCAANPTPKESQLIHLKNSVELIKNNFPNTEVIAVWVNENKYPEEISP